MAILLALLFGIIIIILLAIVVNMMRMHFPSFLRWSCGCIGSCCDLTWAVARVVVEHPSRGVAKFGDPFVRVGARTLLAVLCQEETSCDRENESVSTLVEWY